MQPPFPSPVATWHNNTYDAISPTRAELSCVGKTVIVTGAGSGIGRETALAFAIAGAKQVVLIGRNPGSLAETKEALEHATGSRDAVTVSAFTADVTDVKAMANVALQVGTWDVLVLNAGYIPKPAHVAAADLEDSWLAYETNVKPVLIVAKTFLPTAHKARACLLGVVPGPIALPPAAVAGLSAYICSKTAMVKTLEFVAAEDPELFVASVHPGMVDTALFRRSGATPEMLPMDDVSLPAHFLLWLASSEASFLNGKFVWANWDVSELKAAVAKLPEDIMTLGVKGWPYQISN